MFEMCLTYKQRQIALSQVSRQAHEVIKLTLKCWMKTVTASFLRLTHGVVFTDADPSQQHYPGWRVALKS